MAKKWKEGAAQRKADSEHRRELRQLFHYGRKDAARFARMKEVGTEHTLAEEAAAEEEKREAEREKARQARLARMAEEGTEEVRAEDAAKMRQAYWSNPEPHRARRREQTRKGISGHRFEKLRTPAWLTPDELAILKAIKDNRQPSMHVDHIVPRNDHPEIAGLHVPWNLQYLSAAKNSQRSRGRANEFRPTPDEMAEYVANGMAVWKKDVADDGVIDWSEYPRPSSVPPMTIKF